AGFVAQSAIPDARIRITWLSRLLLAEPALDVTAYVDRTVRELAAASGGRAPGRHAQRALGQRSRSGTIGGTVARVAPGAVVNPAAVKPHLEPLDPWTDDQRPMQDVIAATLPAFVSMTADPDKPIFSE
ncbi:MAG TPA: hypothetical protein VEZ12_08480, partial [Herpetosiphonaceae bacterium]|nr:hypothetical protein [Herpetosiphonaceae bacterium]